MILESRPTQTQLTEGAGEGVDNDNAAAVKAIRKNASLATIKGRKGKGGAERATQAVFVALVHGRWSLGWGAKFKSPDPTYGCAAAGDYPASETNGRTERNEG